MKYSFRNSWGGFQVKYGYGSFQLNQTGSNLEQRSLTIYGQAKVRTSHMRTLIPKSKVNACH